MFYIYNGYINYKGINKADKLNKIGNKGCLYRYKLKDSKENSNYYTLNDLYNGKSGMGGKKEYHISVNNEKCAYVFSTLTGVFDIEDAFFISDRTSSFLDKRYYKISEVFEGVSEDILNKYPHTYYWKILSIENAGELIILSQNRSVKDIVMFLFREYRGTSYEIFEISDITSFIEKYSSIDDEFIINYISNLKKKYEIEQQEAMELNRMYYSEMAELGAYDDDR